jgi:ATP-dependent Zn protease
MSFAWMYRLQDLSGQPGGMLFAKIGCHQPPRKGQMFTQLECPAYHEAGHAVAAWVEKCRLRVVTIVPTESTLGSCLEAKLPRNFRPDITVTPTTADRLEREIICFLAGHIAEKQFSGQDNWDGSLRDRQEADRLADYLVGNQREHDAFMGWMWMRTDGLVEVHQPEIAAMAAALLEEKTIKAPRFKEIMRTALLVGSHPQVPV